MCFWFSSCKTFDIFLEKIAIFLSLGSNQHLFLWRIFAPWQQKKGACNLYKGYLVEKLASRFYIWRINSLNSPYLEYMFQQVAKLSQES